MAATETPAEHLRNAQQLLRSAATDLRNPNILSPSDLLEQRVSIAADLDAAGQRIQRALAQLTLDEEPHQDEIEFLARVLSRLGNAWNTDGQEHLRTFWRDQARPVVEHLLVLHRSL